LRGGLSYLVGISLIPIAALVLIWVIVLETGLVAWQPPVLWVEQFGTSGKANNAVTGIADGNSSLYVAGYLGASLFVRSYDGDHKLLWQRQFGNASVASVSLAEGGGAAYVYGSVNGSAFLRKYDSSGTEIWSSSFGGIFAEGGVTAVTVARSTIFIAGISYPGGNDGIFLRSYDLNGSLLWAKLSGSNITGNRASGIVSGSSGFYLVGNEPVPSSWRPSGAFVRMYDSFGNLTWSRGFEVPTVSPQRISRDSTGIYVTGTTQLPLAGNVLSGEIDLFVRKYDFNGNVLWTRESNAPDNSNVLASGITSDDSGTYVSLHANHAFVQKYDTNGDLVWWAQIGGQTGPLATIESTVTSSNGLYVAGFTFGILAGQKMYSIQDAFVEEFATSSSLIFFGINPPFSFVAVALLGGGVVLSFLLLRRLWKKKVHPSSTNMMRFGSDKNSRVPKTMVR